MSRLSAAICSSDLVLWMSGFGAGYGNRVILDDIDLELPHVGLHMLMGPTGVGKSTLLRTICGLAQQSANFKTWGDIRYLDLMPGEAGWPSLVAQDARLFVSTVFENLANSLCERERLTRAQQFDRINRHLEATGCESLTGVLNTPVFELELFEQRIVAVLRQTLNEPELLCVDEPTAGLNDEHADQVLKVLECWARDHAVLMASHHQGQARQYASAIVFMASGKVQENRSAERFFSGPETVFGQQFLDRGTCDSPRPDTPEEELADDAVRPAPLTQQAVSAMSAWAGPNGFVWLEKGRLAGTPRPGVVSDLETDLDALSRVGVTRLLTLLESPLNCTNELSKRGLLSRHIVIDDMAAPTLEQAIDFCRQIDEWLDKGEVVAVHCHAGHGRTGTALGCWRVWHGQTAAKAVIDLRQLERRWIQSREQAEFLEEFEGYLRSA